MRRKNLKNSGIRTDERERRLDSAGGIGWENGLHKLPLQLVRRRSRCFKITFLVLLSSPVAAWIPANKGINSHFSDESLSSNSLTNFCEFVQILDDGYGSLWLYRHGLGNPNLGFHIKRPISPRVMNKITPCCLGLKFGPGL